MKELLRSRNGRICADFDRLYREERIRFDDCIKRLTEKYFLSEATIMSIIKGYKRYTNER